MRKLGCVGLLDLPVLPGGAVVTVSRRADKGGNDGYTQVMAQPATRSFHRRNSRYGQHGPTMLIGVKGTADLRKRMKLACAEEGMTYGELIAALLDIREARLRKQRASQSHPLARPGAGYGADDG